MPALGGAIALPQVHHVAVMVGQHLHLDVPRMLDVLFQVDAAVAKGGLGLTRRLRDCRLQRQIVQGHPHAATATAGAGFDQHGKTNLVRHAHRFRFVGDQPRAAGHHGHVGFAG